VRFSSSPFPDEVLVWHVVKSTSFNVIAFGKFDCFEAVCLLPSLVGRCLFWVLSGHCHPVTVEH